MSKPSLGIGTNASTSTGLIAVVNGITPFFPDKYKPLIIAVGTLLSPGLSFLFIHFYNRFNEDPVLRETRKKLESDLKNIKKSLRDKRISDEVKSSEFMPLYVETSKKIATLGSEYIDEKYKKPTNYVTSA